MTLTISHKTAKLSARGNKILKKHIRNIKLKETRLMQFGIKIKKLITQLKPIGTKVRQPTVVNDLIIIFRHVYIDSDIARFPNKSRPAGFSHLGCLKNLLETILASKYLNRVKLHVFYNGTLDEFNSDQVSTLLSNSGVHASIKLVEAKSAVESALIMLETIDEISENNDDLIYILENDYLHDPNWIEEVFDVYSSDTCFDYLSLYDHPDRYKIPKNYTNSCLYVSNKRHWITAPSTCGTFILKKSVFNRDYQWLFSTKNDHQMFKRLTGKLKRKLITPIPGLSVHCMNDHLDTVQHFETYFEIK